MAEVIVDVAFLRFGKAAPKNSGFKGKVSGKSLFGGFLSYTNREDATKNSMKQDLSKEAENITDTRTEDPGRNAPDNKLPSFTGYTSRGYATENSSETRYFTASNEGKLYTDEDRNRWIAHSKSSFSKDGDLAWTVVVSLENYKLLPDYGIKDQTDFANITQIALYKACKRMHLDYNNLIWWEDYHTNTDHPHMHITFLEKEHTRDRGKFTKKEIDGLKQVFYTELAARKRYRERFGSDAEADLKKLPDLRNEVVEAAKGLKYGTIHKIVDLYAQLPRSGRLQYASANMNPYREQLDEIVEDILKIDEVQTSYKEFCEMANRFSDNVNEIGNADVSVFFDSQNSKLKKQIANSVLQEFKNYSKDNSVIDVQHEWKLDHSADILIPDVVSIPKEDMSAAEQNMAEAITVMDTERIVSLLNNLDDSSTSEYLDGAAKILTDDQKDSGADRPQAEEGVAKIFSAASKGCKQAIHYRNYYSQSMGMDKSKYHTYRSKLAYSLTRGAKRAISQQKNELEDEIEKYLKNERKKREEEETVYLQDTYESVYGSKNV